MSVMKLSISSFDPPTSNMSSTTVTRMFSMAYARRASDSSEGNMVEAGGKRQTSGITLANSSSSSLISFTQLFKREREKVFLVLFQEIKWSYIVFLVLNY